MRLQNIQGFQTLGNTNIVLRPGSSVTGKNVPVVRDLRLEGMRSRVEPVCYLTNVTRKPTKASDIKMSASAPWRERETLSTNAPLRAEVT